MAGGWKNFRVIPVEWPSREGEQARAIRHAVFVEEQRVPEAEEWDEMDATAHHVVAVDREGRAWATGRLLVEDAGANVLRIGRMAVLREARGRGAGMAVLVALVREALVRGAVRIVLGAQTHAIGFYEKAGFLATGPEYQDTGIPHRLMEAEAARAREFLERLESASD